MSYPYGRPGGSGSGDPRGVGVPGGQRGVGVPGGQWVPVAGSGGSGSGGRGSSAGVIVGCLVGLVVAALVGGVAFVALRSGGSEPGLTLTMTNNTNNPEYALDHIPTLTQNGVIFDLANFSADQNMKVLTGDDVTTVEPGETVSVVAAYKYVYVGEPVVFVTHLSLHEHALDFPEIVVQPS